MALERDGSNRLYMIGLGSVAQCYDIKMANLYRRKGAAVKARVRGRILNSQFSDP